MTNSVSVNFDYADSTGNLKSETTAEDYPMTPHPSEWLPTCEDQLMTAKISPDFVEIDGVSGATGGKTSANLLMETILTAAKTGDTSTQVVVAE